VSDLVKHLQWEKADAERRVQHWRGEYRKALEGLRLSEQRLRDADAEVRELKRKLAAAAPQGGTEERDP
jgi:hypothetical protein